MVIILVNAHLRKCFKMMLTPISIQVNNPTLVATNRSPHLVIIIGKNRCFKAGGTIVVYLEISGLASA